MVKRSMRSDFSWFSCFRGLCVFLALLASTTEVAAQVITGTALYTQYCGNCHTNPAPGSRAPDREALAARTPESILDTITTGSMAQNASALKEIEGVLRAVTTPSTELDLERLKREPPTAES